MGATIKKSLILTLLILSSYLASAQIIGGEVFYENNMEPSWQNVFVYDKNNTNNYFEVLVSPDKFRYSFLNSKVDKPQIFSEGSTIRAEILDFENGLAAGPIDMRLDSGDYQIFSRMEFREVVQLKQPNQELIISPEKNYTLQANIYDDCDSFLVKENTSKQICWRGCDYKETEYGKLGENNFHLITDCKTGDRIKGSSRDVSDLLQEGEEIYYQKQIISSNQNNSEFKINFYGTKTNQSFSVTDFIPKEFDVYNVSNNGYVFEEDGYYSIEWKRVEGGNFNFTYYIKPKPKLDSCNFGINFKSTNQKLELRKSFENSSINLQDTNIKNQEFYFNCNFSTKISFQMIESVNIEKNIPAKIKNGLETKVKIKLTPSQNINNIEFKEYVPKELDISDISNGGVLEPSTSTHNVVIWNVSGDKINLEYKIKPKETGDFFVVSELGGNRLEEDQISVYNFIPPISSPRGKSSGGSSGVEGTGSIIGSMISPPYKYEPENFSKITNKNPIIRQDENMLVAFYSKIFKDKAAFDLFQFTYEGNYNKTLEYLKSYEVETNMAEDERNSTVFEYVVNKSFLKNNNYKDIKFYTRKKGSFVPITGGVIAQNDDSIKYGFESIEPISEFFIFAEKDDSIGFFQKLFSRIRLLFKNIFTK